MLRVRLHTAVVTGARGSLEVGEVVGFGEGDLVDDKDVERDGSV